MSGSKTWLLKNIDGQTAVRFGLGATGAGLAAGAAVSELLAGSSQWAACLLAMLLIGSGLSLVWRRNGIPWRLLKVAFRPETPWTIREAVIAPVLLLVLPVLAVVGGGLLSLLVVALAAGLLYAQSQVLQTAEGVPAWRVQPIMGLILATGFAEGAGALTLVSSLFDSASVSQAVRLAIVLVVVRWPLWTFYRDAVLAAPAADGTKAALRQFNMPFQAIGLLAPIGVLTVAVLTPAFGDPLAAFGGLLAIAGGWALKYTIIARTDVNQGVMVPTLPAPAEAPAKPSQAQGQA